MRRWKARVEEIRRRHEAIDSRATFVQRRRQRIGNVFASAGGPKMRGLRWRPLPPGTVTREGLKRHYDELSKKNRGAHYDYDRIEKAMDLGPKELHEEIDAEIEGYIVFTFEHTPSVLLECPRVGNAIYVIHRDWESWSKTNKQELIDDESGSVVRIPHQGDWYTRVKRELGLDRAARKGGSMPGEQGYEIEWWCSCGVEVVVRGKDREDALRQTGESEAEHRNKGHREFGTIEPER